MDDKTRRRGNICSILIGGGDREIHFLQISWSHFPVYHELETGDTHLQHWNINYLHLKLKLPSESYIF